jgi:DNA-binding transcriptional MerR regulator
MQHAHFRIGELAQRVGVERFVIRFWEKEFKLRSPRSRGGQRFYTQKDLDTFQVIKNLLYEQRFTIAGAKNFIKGQKNVVIGSYRTDLRADPSTDQLYKDLRMLRAQLIKLKDVL